MGEKRNNDNELFRKFRRILLESVDEGLNLLGESVKNTVYYYINKNDCLKREDIPLKPEDFSKALRNIFGSVGASFIEDQILKSLYRKIGAEYVREEHATFKDHIEKLMNLYREKLSG
ncbi:hypothetical protein CP083_06785 [Candidatus Bathyarchaeota archaeon B24-2]|nr:MAG: hypothetical protein CP083_06785 [Candidatus Bathyarchaeota archaeon B24-2]